MKAIADFLLELDAMSVRVSVAGDRLLCEAPPGVLTHDLRQRMSAYKPEILRLLGEPAQALNDGEAEPPRGLSRMQSVIWLQEKVIPGSFIWNMANAYDVHGPLDRRALEASFRGMIERHASLHSRLVEVDGTTTLEAVPLDDWHLEFEDLRGLPDPGQAAVALIKAEAERPFDLTKTIPCRVRLLQTADASHVLVLVLHHIAADGWSLGLISRELGCRYQAELRGEPCRLAPPRADYQDFVRQERIDEAASAEDLEWWRQQLSGDLPVLSLTALRSRAHGGGGRRTNIGLGPELTARIENFAQRHRATPFMVLLAAYQLLIHYRTGQTDVLVCGPVSGRDRREFTDVIGMFVNTVVLRTAIAPDQTFVELLGRVRETCLAAFARQHVPFQRVVEAVEPRRVANTSQLVQLGFAYQNVPLPPLQLEATEVIRRPSEFGGAHCQVTVEIYKNPDGFVCDFIYATALFDAATIDRMMEQFRKLLLEIVTDPARKLSDLPYLPDAERKLLLTGWRGTTTDYPADRLEHLFAARAAATPSAEAVIHRNSRLSYRNLDRRANRLANHLRAFGVGPDVLVGVCLERSPDLVVAILAVLKAGGGYVPLDPAYPEQRLAFMLTDSTAQVLVTRTSLRHLVPAPRHVVDLDADRAAIAAAPDSAPSTGATAENLAYVIYTSGSTGMPKGTALRHSAANLVHWAQRTFGRDALARVVAPSSICFDPSVLELFATLCSGGTLILAENHIERPDAANRPTLLSSVPSALAELVRARAIPDSVRVVITGGEPLKNSLVQELYKTTKVERLYNLYGPTEYTTVATAALTVRGAKRAPPIGGPIDNTQVYVLDASQRMVPIGVSGELCIAGDGLARGYLGQPDLTADAFIANPFGPPGSRLYRTGDIVRWSTEGELEFIGRSDHQVKLRGFRVELGEVEASLLRHEAIREAVAVLHEDRPGDQRLVAYVVTEGGASLPADLRQKLRRWLPDYMIPAAIAVLPALPLSQSGKIDRAALWAPTIDDPEMSTEPRWMPPVQEIAADAFKLVLGLDYVGPDDNFFELGGNSLLAVRVVSHLETLLEQPISPVAIFQAQTPRQLGPHLEAKLASPKSHVAAIQPLGNRPPLFCLHDLLSLPLSYASLARQLAPDQPMYAVVPGPREAAVIAEPAIETLVATYLAEIRRIQPHGPYRVLGYSHGGVFAFEVARSLLAQGDEVELILIDPYISRRKFDLATTFRWVWRNARQRLKPIWESDRRPLGKLAATGREAYCKGGVGKIILKALLTLLINLRPRQDVAVPDWVPETSRPLARSLLRAIANHRFRPFAGSTVFVQGTVRDFGESWLNRDRLNGWFGLFQGSLTCLEVQANHFWVMRDPRVREVARIIRGEAKPRAEAAAGVACKNCA